MISVNRKAVRAAGGTQSDELAAKIKSVTSATTVGSVFVYDTRNDSDSGAWRKKTSHTSWASEAASATRSARSEFPSVALIVADNAGSDATLKIYDLDDVAAPLWMSFTQTGAISWASGSAPTFSAVYALNGRVYLTGDDKVGLLEINFAADDMRIGYSSAYVFTSGRDIASRNVTSAVVTGGDGYEIVNDTVNDVAATVLEGAEIGALGLPIPTIACATANKISVIHPNGTVADLSDSASTRAFVNVAWRDDGSVVGYNSANGAYQSFRIGSIYADTNTNDFRFENGSATNIPNPITNADSTAIAYGNGKLYGGNSGGLTIFNENKGNPAESLFAYIDSDYNTGYMLGDIRLALAETRTTPLYSTNQVVDRSVKEKVISVNGTITNSVVDTSAELSAYSGFSTDNYLSRAYDADFDFGTGDFSIMLWVKLANTVNTTETAILRNDVTDASKATIGVDFVNGVPRLLAYGGGWNSTTAQTDLSDNLWHQVLLFRRSGKVFIYVDGKYDLSYSGGNTVGNDLSNNTATMRIGLHNNGNNPLANGSLSLVRISATAPTPQQVADIYRAEAPLFRSGAKCLLQHSTVHALDYDKSTDLLSVGQTAASGNEGVTKFRGLENVAQFTGSDHASWSGDSIKKISTAGGVSAFGRTDSTGGVLVDLPAIDVRGDLNTADTKLPDDGKIHFSAAIDDGVSANPTVIGVLPIAEGDTYLITARVFCRKYVDNSSNIRASYVIKQRVNRPVGGNATANTPLSVLRDEGTASMDAVFSADTGSQQIRLTVTGVANNRSIWTAELDVERESEKQYER